MPGYRHVAEYDALYDPRVAAAIERADIRLASYGDSRP
jgi:hypothetical protein